MAGVTRHLRAGACAVVVGLCFGAPRTGAGQVPPPRAPADDPESAPPLGGPLAALIPPALARAMTCRPVTPAPNDDRRPGRPPWRSCSGRTRLGLPEVPDGAGAEIDAGGEVIDLDLTWEVPPRAGEDTVRAAALARAHAAAIALLGRAFGPAPPCRGDGPVWRRDSLSAAVLPPRREKVRATLRHATRADYAALARRNYGLVWATASFWRPLRCDPPPARGPHESGPGRGAPGEPGVGAPPSNEALQLSGPPGRPSAPAGAAVRGPSRAWMTRS